MKSSIQTKEYHSHWMVENRPLIIAMAFSLIIKLILSGIGREINPDGVLYIAAAQQYAAGNFREGLALYRMPAFPLLLAAVHLLVPGWVAAARVITIGSMVLATIPLYKTTERLFDRNAAFWAALFLAVTPAGNENVLRVIRDPTFFCLAISVVFFLVKGIQVRQVRWVVVGSLFTCVALLFRVEGVVLLTVPPAFMLVLALTSKVEAMRSFARKSAAFWVGIPLIIAIVLALVFGPHIMTRNRINELSREVYALAKLAVFEKYSQIYTFLKQIQSEPPFSGYSHSLPATVRHWMPLVYLIGLLESLIKALYPLYFLPLFFLLTKPSRSFSKLTAEKKFVLVIFGGYMLALFYILITRDKMIGRLLFTPAVLLYPWVGHGFRLGIDALQKRKLGRALQTVAVLLFIVLPCVENVEKVVKSDRSAMAVGQFIIHDPYLRDATLLFSETSHSFYSNSLDHFSKTRKLAKQIGKHIKEGRTAEIETIAHNYEADALVLFFNLGKDQKILAFSDYYEFRRIPGEKGVTVIYLAK
jgi:hypothetical protein